VSDVKKRVLVKTLGCKVNQYESSALGEALEGRGFELISAEGEAEVVVVNTCTVTHRSERDARQMIRRVRREHPNAYVVATGCYAQISGDKALEAGADLVAGTAWKAKLADLIKKERSGVLVTDDFSTLLAPELVTGLKGRTRGFFKVQDGCEAFCNYCIIPHARGPSRSLPPDEVRSGLQRMLAAGHREVVLTGIHIGRWGHDLEGSPALPDLLAIAEDSGIPRVRISSLEPLEATAEVVDMVAASKVLCPHLHIPLQSGSDAVLKAMGRPYGVTGFRERVEYALSRIPGLCLGFDLITGFPGERPEDFEDTLKLLRSIDFAYLHVFPYSRRKGTPAAKMPAQIPDMVKRERAAALRKLSAERNLAFHEQRIGKTFAALAEGSVTEGALRLRARDYTEVYVKWSGGETPADEVNVTASHIEGHKLWAKL